MKRPKLKTHLYCRGNWTYCGRVIDGYTGSPLNRDGTVPPSRVFTNEPQHTTCKICLKASGNTQAPEGACSVS